jgi:hypothetical protein
MELLPGVLPRESVRTSREFRVSARSVHRRAVLLGEFETTSTRCGSPTLPWRHSVAWWAFTCWTCHFVTFGRAEETEAARDDLQEVQR